MSDEQVTEPDEPTIEINFNGPIPDEAHKPALFAAVEELGKAFGFKRPLASLAATRYQRKDGSESVKTMLLIQDLDVPGLDQLLGEADR